MAIWNQVDVVLICLEVLIFDDFVSFYPIILEFGIFVTHLVALNSITSHQLLRHNR